MAVWFQLIISACGTSSRLTICFMSSKNCYLRLSKCSGLILFLLHALHLTIPMWFNKLQVHQLVILMLPDPSKLASLLITMPSAAAITTVILMTVPRLHINFKYSLTWSSNPSPSKRGLPVFLCSNSLTSLPLPF